GGVINIITKAPPLDPEYGVWSEGGSSGHVRSGFSAGATYGAFGYTLNGNLITSGGSRDRTAKRERAVSAKGVWDVSADTKLTLRGEYQKIWDQQPGTLSAAEYAADWQQAVIHDAFEDNSFSTVSGSLEHDFSDMASGKVAYSGRKTTAEGPTALSYKSGYVDEEALDHNLVVEYKHHLDFLSTKIVGGADLQYSDYREKSYGWVNDVSVQRGALQSDWDLLAETASPFAQVQFSPVERVEFTFGGRFDKIRYTGVDKLGTSGKLKSDYQNFSKKAGVSIDLTDRNVLWLGYGEAFVVPSRSRLFTSKATISRGRMSGYNADPNLNPETAKNYSAGLRGSLFDDRFGYDVAVYYTNIYDMVVGVDRDGTLAGRVYTNAGEVRGSGLESMFYFKPHDMVRLDASYTYAENKFTDFVDEGVDYTGKYVAASPLHHLNARLTVMPIPELEVELEWDHISSFYTSDLNDDPFGKYRRPDLWHLRVDYQVGTWSVWGQIRNLTDTKYADSVSYSTRSGRSYTPGDGRFFAAGARVTF
ncbi:MAG TPA: TonB-dependent receptor, partial [Kaistiaceae bacterium]|nr:TonB-dependent receptor [Kaistiaceae bacterium]